MHVKVKLSEILSCSRKHQVFTVVPSGKTVATKMNTGGCLLLILSLGHDLISLGTVEFTL